MDLCRIVVYCESDCRKYFPFYPKPKSGSAYAFKLDLIVLLIPECIVKNDEVKIVTKEGKKLEIDLSDLVADLINHESMHMILHHLEGYLASKKLDSLDNLLRHLFRMHAHTENSHSFFSFMPYRIVHATKI